MSSNSQICSLMNKTLVLGFGIQNGVCAIAGSLPGPFAAHVFMGMERTKVPSYVRAA